MIEGWDGFVVDYQVLHRKGSQRWGIEVKCPYCLNDPSYRMGLKTNGRSYGCIVDKSHGGGNPAKLIAAILNCSAEQARQIAIKYFRWVSEKSTNTKESSESKISPILEDPEFFKFKDWDIPILVNSQRPFVDYLVSRDMDINYVGNRYDLRWTISGRCANRVIVPIKYKRQWYSWTARSILKGGLRYLSGSTNPPGEFLFDFDNLTGGRMLVVCEGWADAHAVNACFLPGIQGTCLFGKRISDNQITGLLQLSDFYDKILVLLDRDAFSDSLSIKSKLDFYFNNVEVTLTPGKDPSDLPRQTLKDILNTSIGAKI